ncbi:MAG: hypothetical protein DA405_06730 [Bacteroidetes bacterium]|nr:MAG: hypothetical protein DA405_06730 [Bacteroidota bacterium]
MTKRLRIILDWEKEDVYRDVVVPQKFNLEHLHLAIVRSFELAEGEMASFYESDNNWNQGDEIPLMAFDPEQRSMPDISIYEIFEKTGDKLLYIYDFLNMWTFYVEQIEDSEEDSDQIKLVLKHGERPAEAPVKNMQGDEDDDSDFSEEDEDEEFGFNEFDDYN